MRPMSGTRAYVVTMTYATGTGRAPKEAALIAAEDALARAGSEGSVAAEPDRRFTITIETAAVHPADALEAATAQIAEADALTPLGKPRLLGVEALDADEYIRRADAPALPPLIGASEAADLLGVTRQRVHQLAAEHPGFPTPLVRVRMGPLWATSAIEGFARSWTRTPGRPHRETGRTTRATQAADDVRTAPDAASRAAS